MNTPQRAGSLAEPGRGSAAVGAEAVEELARRIATDAPELAELPPRELAAVAKAVLAGKLTEELRAKVDVAGIDYEEEKRIFLESFPSAATREAYGRALAQLEAFARRRGRSVLELRPRDADAFIRAVEGSAATVRLRAAGASSFYGFLERETEGRIKNPFHGTRSRPPSMRKRILEIPSEEELSILLEAVDPHSELGAAIAVMAYRGMRVGGLPELTIKGGRFWTRSKGKDLSGELGTAAVEVLEAAGLPLRAPFAGLTARKIADRMRRATRRLAAEGKLEAAYSVHDLRHFFAVREYRRTKDLYRVSKLLGHASIQVTETYLRGLGELD
jgi:integrase